MKKIVRVLSMLFSAVMIMGMFSFLFGCAESDDPEKYKKEENGFYYIYSKKGSEKISAIIGLVDEDMVCDELVIPEKLGGRSVKYIGMVTQKMGVSPAYYKINAKKIDILIFNYEVGIAYFAFDNFNGRFIFNFDVSKMSGFDTFKRVNSKKCIFFDGNGGQLITYAMFLYKGRAVIKPQDPTKKGYVFNGWYADSDLTTKWDFENDLIPGEMTLFAKWIQE